MIFSLLFKSLVTSCDTQVEVNTPLRGLPLILALLFFSFSHCFAFLTYSVSSSYSEYVSHPALLPLLLHLCMCCSLPTAVWRVVVGCAIYNQ